MREVMRLRRVVSLCEVESLREVVRRWRVVSLREVTAASQPSLTLRVHYLGSADVTSPFGDITHA